MKKADNFDAGKWLVENKITTQSRLDEDETPVNEEASLDDVLSKEELIDRLEQVFGSEDMSRLNFFQKLAINMVKKQIISKIKSGQIQTRAGIKAALSGN